MEGIHLLGKFEECECDMDNLIYFEKVRDDIISIISSSGLKVMGDKFCSFNKKEDDKFGWTGAVILSESHVTFHCAPEDNRSIHVDVFTCNYSGNNDDKARFVLSEFKKLFKAKLTNYEELKR